MNVFKLVSVYEVIIQDQVIARPVRIDILQSTIDSHMYRPRIWARNTYNVYPMSLNRGPQGEDLHKIHSSDDINIDVSAIIAEDESFFTGKHYDSEEEVLEYALSLVKNLYGELQE